MNIGSVDPNFTGSRALAGLEMHNLLLDQETFGTHKGNFITKQSRQTKSSRTTLELYL
jgi:hypothetical protein